MPDFPAPKLSTKRFLSKRSRRVLTADGIPNVVRRGATLSSWQDLYHWLLMLPWPIFLLFMGLCYIVSNILFAIAYLIGGNHIENAEPGSFADAFFFSVQTMASIGYGAMYPRTTYGNVLVTIESLLGLMGLALVTGLIFARFSRPTARVLFSDVAVITPFDGVPSLIFRVANQRRNRILEASIRVTLMRNETTTEGFTLRRFYDLKLVRSETPIFALGWIVIHPITADSPLHGRSTLEDLQNTETEIIITLTGIDETVSQTIHARHDFIPEDIRWNMYFVDLFQRLPNGKIFIDYDRFHEVTPAPPNSLR